MSRKNYSEKKNYKVRIPEKVIDSLGMVHARIPLEGDIMGDSPINAVENYVRSYVKDEDFNLVMNLLHKSTSEDTKSLATLVERQLLLFEE